MKINEKAINTIDIDGATDHVFSGGTCYGFRCR
jgi:hypothetical protein